MDGPPERRFSRPAVAWRPDMSALRLVVTNASTAGLYMYAAFVIDGNGFKNQLRVAYNG